MMSEIDRITYLLRRQIKKQKLPKTWKTFIATLPDDTRDDGDSHLETVSQDIIGTAFIINYTDAKNNESERRIMVRCLGYAGDDLALTAFCYEREAVRCFLVRRIDQAANCATGEIIENPLEYFHQLSSSDPTAEALERSAVGIHILISLAICDGHFHKYERDVVLNYVDYNAPSLDIDWKTITQFINAAQPDLNTFDKAVLKLRFRGKREKQNIIFAGKNLVLADGILRKEEVELMEILMKP